MIRASDRLIVTLLLSLVAALSFCATASARKPAKDQLPAVLALAEKLDAATQTLNMLAEARATDADTAFMGTMKRLCTGATHFHRILQEAQGDEDGAHTQKAFGGLRADWVKTSDAWAGCRVKGSDSTAKQFKRVRKLIDLIEPYYNDSLPAPGND